MKVHVLVLCVSVAHAFPDLDSVASVAVPMAVDTITKDGRIIDSEGQEVTLDPRDQGLNPKATFSALYRNAKQDDVLRAADALQQKSRHPNITYTKPPMGSCVIDPTSNTRLCTQDKTNPVCPKQFYSGARVSCHRLALFLHEVDQDKMNVTVSWWADQDCLIHRTLCTVDHPKHRRQFEDETYDFSRTCEERTALTFHYQYHIVLPSGKHYDKLYHGFHTLAHNEPQTIFRIYDNEKPYLEHSLTVLMFEKDAFGAITFKPEDLDQSVIKFRRGDMTGMYVQFAGMQHRFATATKPESFLSQKGNAQVTKVPYISRCTKAEKDEWHQLKAVMIIQPDDKHHGGHRTVLVVVAIGGMSEGFVRGVVEIVKTTQ